MRPLSSSVSGRFALLFPLLLLVVASARFVGSKRDIHHALRAQLGLEVEESNYIPKDFDVFDRPNKFLLLHLNAVNYVDIEISSPFLANLVGGNEKEVDANVFIAENRKKDGNEVHLTALEKVDCGNNDLDIEGVLESFGDEFPAGFKQHFLTENVLDVAGVAALEKRLNEVINMHSKEMEDGEPDLFILTLDFTNVDIEALKKMDLHIKKAFKAMMENLGSKTEVDLIVSEKTLSQDRNPNTWDSERAESRILQTDGEYESPLARIQPTEKEKVEFILLLWTNLVLIVILLFILCCVNWQAELDPILYSNFKEDNAAPTS